MTDDELKELVASLAIAQKENSAAQKENSLQMKELRLSDVKVKEDQEESRIQMKELRLSDVKVKEDQEESRIQMKELRLSHVKFKEDQEESRIQMKELREQQKETTRKLDKVAKMIGGIGANQGDVAEDFFFNSFVKEHCLGTFQFDEVIRNIRMHKGKTQEEYDLLLVNGKSIVIIEVKYKAHQNDVVKLQEKINNFKRLLPVYEKYTLYGGMASFHFNKNIKNSLLEEGYYVVERSGKLIHTESSKHLKVA